MQDPFLQHRLSLARIARNAQVIPPEFLNSPQYNCEPLSEALGCHQCQPTQSSTHEGTGR